MRALMIQGTSSGSGKTTVVAALCHALSRRGFSVAPFKTENISLNSYVARRGGPKDVGGEMAVAQAFQAMLAGEEPSTDMNPILIKPRAGMMASVIINGAWVGDFAVGSSSAFSRQTGLQLAREAIERLGHHDLLIAEGMGSPAEINLYDRDIANMRTAELLKSPVVLVGDIERGGVFASLYGTYRLLPPRWRRLVKGFVINRMGGDPSLLGEAPRKLEAATGVPVLGVIPYVPELELNLEDSLQVKGFGKGPVDVVVIEYPGASILTDIEPLRFDPSVSVRFAQSRGTLGSPDVIVLPGSKSVRSDLAWMRKQDLDEELIKAAGRGSTIVGICGGAQMLGKTLDDPMGLEGERPGEDAGLGLLNAVTRFSNDKVVRRVTAVDPKGEEIEAFEIHKGRTSWEGGCRSLFQTENGPEGCVKGRIYASLLHHALFYDPNIRAMILGHALRSKGAEERKPQQDTSLLIEKFGTNAEKVLMKSVDIDRILSIVEEGLEGSSG
ncbi:MAG: cobyric acid synthase [Thermoprotei archaeon]